MSTNRNARGLAQEASSWYQSHLDPYSSHRENVEKLLRVPVLGLTLQILTQKHRGGDDDAFTDDTKDATWRSYLRGLAEDSNSSWTSFPRRAEYNQLGHRHKSRMEAFLVGCALAVPEEPDGETSTATTATTTSSSSSGDSRRRHTPPKPAPADISLKEGLAGYTPTGGLSGYSKEGLAGYSPTDVLSLNGNGKKGVGHPQFGGRELTTRLELYIRQLLRVASTGQDCVVAMESQKVVQARAHGVCRAFVATVGCVSSIGPTLTSLLVCLTKELLAVETVSDEILWKIKRVASEYEHQTSFASLAFLSSPEQSAGNVLTPLVVTYIRYLQLNWEALLEQCNLERMFVSVLDADMRHLFKTVEFRSIGHLLEVCQGFQTHLQSIEIPPEIGGITENFGDIGAGDMDSLCSSAKAIKQALRDLQREVVTVNGHTLPPVASRRELVRLLSQTLNSRSLFTTKRTRRKAKTGASKRIPKVASCPSVIPTQKYDGSAALDSEGFLSSEYEGDTDGSSPLKPPPPSSSSNRSVGSRGSSSRGNRRRGTFHLSTVDVMTRRLLLASSRTGMGGDAYFIVRDLFGGEEVEVVPTTQYVQQQQPFFHGRTRAGTIEILVRLASVTIKCHASFDVYPKSLVGDCEPLIQLHTTTTETIALQEVRASDCQNGKGKVDNAGSGNPSDEEGSGDSGASHNGDADRVMVLQEKKTDRTGWRTVAIRPALYERVQEWNTPS